MKSIIKFIKLLGVPTPKIGKNIRNAGLALIGGGSTGLAASASLPEVPDSWIELMRVGIELISAIALLIGTLMTGAGQAQVKGDPDKI